MEMGLGMGVGMNYKAIWRNKKKEKPWTVSEALTSVQSGVPLLATTHDSDASISQWSELLFLRQILLNLRHLRTLQAEP